jgi:uncharacterized protein
MQMIERPWGVAVQGAASVRAVPDIARVRLRVTRLEQTPSASFAQASDAVRAAREVLRAHGVPDADVERSRLRLRSSFGHGPDRRLLGYECSASFLVTCRDLDGVQRLLIDVVAAGASEIESVDFDVAGRDGLRAQARRQAVTRARAKAELYAEAAGARLGPVLHLEDDDPDREDGLRFAAARGGAAGGSGEADLAPGHVVVRAAVTVGYALTHG